MRLLCLMRRASAPAVARSGTVRTPARARGTAARSRVASMRARHLLTATPPPCVRSPSWPGSSDHTAFFSGGEEGGTSTITHRMDCEIGIWLAALDGPNPAAMVDALDGSTTPPTEGSRRPAEPSTPVKRAAPTEELSLEDSAMDPAEAKRVKRMRRNRESAAMSRERKKQYAVAHRTCGRAARPRRPPASRTHATPHHSAHARRARSASQVH